MEQAAPGCIVLQSVVNNWALARRHSPKNMPIEADARHKMLHGCLGG